MTGQSRGSDRSSAGVLTRLAAKSNQTSRFAGARVSDFLLDFSSLQRACGVVLVLECFSLVVRQKTRVCKPTVWNSMSLFPLEIHAHDYVARV